MTRKTVGSSSSKRFPLQDNPIALVGVAGIFPQAMDVDRYWENILAKVDAIMDVPAERWNPADYFSSDRKAADKTYSKRGGFIPAIPFDPLEFGIPPNILEVTDISQLLSLVVARDALSDAGYDAIPDELRQRTGVILGAVGISMQLFTPVTTRLQYPIWAKVLRSYGVPDELVTEIIEKIKLAYAGWEENTFPGLLPNVIAGRIANRFDLGGPNFTVDAACASSLAALRTAVGELTSGRADMMIAGGVDLDNSINSYLCFSKTPAFTPGDRVRPLDAGSDGMMLGEGLGMVVLKRLVDAERDGDHIYAVLRGMGASSDGRYRSIYAPRSSGQSLALRRAYEEAGFDPQTVGLVEAHGTGTKAGDRAEIDGLLQTFSDGQPARKSIALGSVKSQIGHTKAAAGVASLIKVALSLDQKVLPPTINVSTPEARLLAPDSPFYVNSEARPWIRRSDAPRRAAVSSFGFGGTNFHVVLEEYRREPDGAYRRHQVPKALLFSAPDGDQLTSQLEETLRGLESNEKSVRWQTECARSASLLPERDQLRLGFLARDEVEAVEKIRRAMDGLRSRGTSSVWDLSPDGIFYRPRGEKIDGKMVVLFPGQGSQYVNMGRELALNSPPLREAYAHVDEVANELGEELISEIVFPPPAFSAAERDSQEKYLQLTEHAQPALAAFALGVYGLLREGGLRADFLAGHSFGELSALWAAGVLGDEDYLRLAVERGKAMASTAGVGKDTGAMLAVTGDLTGLEEALDQADGFAPSNWNSPEQVVLAGPQAKVESAVAHLRAKGFSVTRLNVSAAFHSPFVAHAQAPFAQAVTRVTLHSPTVAVFSNTTAGCYPDDPKRVQELLAEHLLNPVRFEDEIEAIYAKGGRVFVEIGPKRVLTGLVESTLRGKEHVSIAINPDSRGDSDLQLRLAVLQLRLLGADLRSFDPYAMLPETAPHRRKPSALTLSLDGAPYGATQRREAFEQALRNNPVRLVPVRGGSVEPMQSGRQALELDEDGYELAEARPAGRAVYDKVSSVVTERDAVAEAPAYADEGRVEGMAKSQIGAEETLPDSGRSCPDDLTEQRLGEARLASSGGQRVQDKILDLEGRLMGIYQQVAENETVVLRRLASSQGREPLFEGALRDLEHHLAWLEERGQELARLEKGGVGESSLSAMELADRQIRELEDEKVALEDDEVIAPQPKGPAALAANGSQDVRSAGQFGNAGISWKAERQEEPQIGLASGTVKVSPVGPRDGVKAVPGTGASTHLAPPKEPPAQKANAGVPSAEGLEQTLLEVVSEKTGYPVETIEMDMDLEADLGVDSIKRVEIMDGVQAAFPGLPVIDTERLAEMRTLRQIMQGFQAEGLPTEEFGGAKTAAPGGANGLEASAERKEVGSAGEYLPEEGEGGTATLVSAHGAQAGASAGAAGRVSLEALEDELVSVVSEKTGYPQETIELDMDMEADLGIDSIKRVEILDALQTSHEDLPTIDSDQLAELRTLRQLGEALVKLVEGEQALGGPTE